MAALKTAAAAALALVAVLYAEPARADEVPPWRAHVAEAAGRFAIPEAWILRVIDAESGGRTHLHGRPITSPAGAMGLMQIMPGTWTELRRQYRLGPDPHDPRDNILAGTAYLRRMYERFGYPGLFAAYNAGPGRYRAYLERGRPLPRETRAYVARIAGSGWIAAPSGHRGGNVLRRADGARRSAPAVPPDPIFLVSAGARLADMPTPNAPAMWPPDLSAGPHMPVGETAAPHMPAASPHDGRPGASSHLRSARDTVFLWRRSAARRGK